jgi:acyl carrier protein
MVSQGLREDQVESIVRDALREVAGAEAAELGGAQRLVNSGVDSLTGARLATLLEQRFAFQIEDEDAGRFRTINDIVRYVLARLRGAKQAANGDGAIASEGSEP